MLIEIKFDGVWANSSYRKWERINSYTTTVSIPVITYKIVPGNENLTVNMQSPSHVSTMQIMSGLYKEVLAFKLSKLRARLLALWYIQGIEFLDRAPQKYKSMGVIFKRGDLTKSSLYTFIIRLRSSTLFSNLLAIILVASWVLALMAIAGYNLVV